VNANCPEACIDSVCEAYATSGGSCDESGDCGPGLDCREGVCKGIEGTACTSNDDCMDVCIQGTCGSSSALGGPCDESDDCEPGLFCTEGVCTQCGNGALDSGETCDDGPGEGEGLCLDDCSGLQNCGNATREGSEACDDGPGEGEGLCLDDCSGVQTCGNATREGTETCDDGPGEGEGLCLDDCSSMQVCGDNIQEGTEVCDVGATCAVDCNATCTGPANTLKRNDLFGDGSIIVTYLFDHGTKSLLQETALYGVYDAQPVGAPSIVTGHIAGAVLLHDGDALAFDAVPLPDGANPRAFSFWLNLDAQPVSQAGILTYGSDSGAPNELFSLCILANGELAVDTNSRALGSGFYPVVDEWVHLVVSYDGVNLEIFVDGALAVEYPVALATGTDTHGKKLGNYDGFHPLSGTIDHLRVFNRALLETEVLALTGECGFPDPLEGSTFSTLVFEDDFGGDLSAWNTWGSPLPRILSDGQASNGFAFDTNGDANYHSGGDTLFSLDHAQGFAVEFRAKQPQDLAVSNKWFYLDLGLTHTQSTNNGTGARTYFRISGISDTNKWELFSPFALGLFSPGNSPIFWDYWNDFDYHVFRIETVLADGMRHFRYFVDGVLFDRAAWEDTSGEPWYVTMQGRSHTYDHYVDWIRIYTP